MKVMVTTEYDITIGIWDCQTKLKDIWGIGPYLTNIPKKFMAVIDKYR